MAQNTSFLDAINREAMKAWANAHCQNYLSDKDIALRSTQTFFTNYIEPFKPLSES